MANGWAPDGAAQDQIDDTVKDAVLRARTMMPAGEKLLGGSGREPSRPERDQSAKPVIHPSQKTAIDQ